MRITAIMALFLSILCCTHQAQASHKIKAQEELVFAYFPMAVPVATLGEVMRRDQILRQRLAKLGQTIRFQPLAKGKDAVTLLKQKQLDGVSFSDLPSVEAAVSGEMQLLGIVKQSYSAIVAASGTQVRDLRRKRIGTVPGSTSHYALLQALHAANIKEQEVQLVPMEAAELSDALARGRVDAVAAWEPLPTAITTHHPNRFTSIHRQVSSSYFLLSRHLLAEHPAAARELAASLLRAVRWMKKRNANLATASQWAAEGMSSFSGKPSPLSAKEIAQITTNDLLNVPGAPLLHATEGSTGSALYRIFDFMQQQGQLPATARWETVRSCVDPALLRQLSANSSKFDLQRFNYAQ